MRRGRRLPRVVQSRVDLIEIGFDVIIAADKVASLSSAKEDARRVGVGGATVFMIGDEAFELRAKGAQGRAFVLRHGPTEVLVNERDVEVRIRPATLQTRSVEASLGYARSVVANLAQVVSAERIRRLDACADVTFSVRDVDPGAFVGRFQKSISFERTAARRNTTSSITFGRGGPLCVRIYDKLEQLRQKGDPTVTASERAEWRRHGWRDGDPVTRVEMQLRGHTLRRLDMRDPARVMRNLDAAWQYVFAKWVRLVEPGTSTRRERAKLDSRWQAVLSATFARSSDAARPLLIDGGGATVEAAIGTVISALAATGLLVRPMNSVSAEEHLARALVVAVRARPPLCAALPGRIDVALARAGSSPAFPVRRASLPGPVRTTEARYVFRERYSIALAGGATEGMARRVALAAVPGFRLLGWAGCFDLRANLDGEQGAE